MNIQSKEMVQAALYAIDLFDMAGWRQAKGDSEGVEAESILEKPFTCVSDCSKLLKGIDVEDKQVLLVYQRLPRHHCSHG